MTDALTSQVDNEAYDRGGIGNALDIAGRENPQEDKSLQSLEMDNEAHDNVGDKPLEEKSNIASSIKLDLDYEVVIANVGDNTVTDIPLKEESCVAPSEELEMDYETDDNDRANAGTDEPLKEKRNNEAHDNVGANGGGDEHLEEKSNVAPSIELELDYEVDDEVVIANVGENTVTDIPLKEESCVAPSKELEMDYEGDDNDGANGGKDEPLKETNNNEAHDNVGANGGTDKPLEGKRNVAPSIERELYNEVDDEVVIANVGDNTVTDEESCVVPSKELEIDYEADDNDRANEGTGEPLKEKSNNEAHGNVGANGATDKPLEEKSNVAPDMVHVPSRNHRKGTSKDCNILVYDEIDNQMVQCGRFGDLKHSLADCRATSDKFGELKSVLREFLNKLPSSEEIIFLSFRHWDKKRLKLAIWCAVTGMFYIFRNKDAGISDMLLYLRKELFFHVMLERWFAGRLNMFKMMDTLSRKIDGV